MNVQYSKLSTVDTEEEKEGKQDKKDDKKKILIYSIVIKHTICVTHVYRQKYFENVEDAKALALQLGSEIRTKLTTNPNFIVEEPYDSKAIIFNVYQLSLVNKFLAKVFKVRSREFLFSIRISVETEILTLKNSFDTKKMTNKLLPDNLF